MSTTDQFMAAARRIATTDRSIAGITGTLEQFNTAVTDAEIARTDAANTFSGIQSFSSTTRPTSAGTGTPASNSLILLSDANARLAPMNGFASNATFSTGTNGVLYLGSYGITNAGNRVFGEWVLNIAAYTSAELSPVLDLTSFDNWRGAEFRLDPLQDSASVGYTAHGFYTSAGPRQYQTTSGSGSSFATTPSYLTITISSSITVVAGDVISDAAGASAVVQVGATSTTVTLAYMNGNKNFTVGSAVSLNGSGAGVTVATVTGTQIPSANADRIVVHRGYLTGSTGGIVIWNNTSSARAFRFRFTR